MFRKIGDALRRFMAGRYGTDKLNQWLLGLAIVLIVLGLIGIMTGEDAVEFLLAGASAVAVGTANFVDPFAPLKVIDGINAYLDRHGIAKVSDLVGKVEC